MYKKIVAVLFCGILCLSNMVGCASSTQSGSKAAPVETKARAVSDAEVQSEKEKKEAKESSLTLLSEETTTNNCYTNDGYYYLSIENTPVTKGETITNIMYVDKASSKEVFLCDKANCKHNSKKCTSVINGEDGALSQNLFTDGNKLYLLVSEADQEGSTTMSFAINSDDVETKSRPAILYQMNLDGSNREKLATFNSGEVVENSCMGDAKNLYFITKSLTEKKVDKNSTYSEASGRRIIQISKASGERTELHTLKTGVKVIGASRQGLVLAEEVMKKELTPKEKMNDEVYKKAMASSKLKLFTMDMTTGEEKTYKTLSQKKAITYLSDANKLYYAIDGKNQIQAIDLVTGKESCLAKTKAVQMWKIQDGYLFTNTWDRAKSAEYIVNASSGKVTKIKQEAAKGISIEMKAKVGNRWLVVSKIMNKKKFVNWKKIYQEEIDSQQMSFITEEDLIAGKTNYQNVNMANKGM